MSRVDYSFKHKGLRVISSDDAWIKQGDKFILNPKFSLLGKVETSMPNLIISVRDRKKPSYKGDIYDLNSTAKKEIVKYFYDDKGKRNKKSVAYLGIEKPKK